MNKLANINDLRPIALRMREREEMLSISKQKICADLGDFKALAVEQGRDIIIVETKLQAFNMSREDWFHAQVPQISKADSERYKRICVEQMEDPRQMLFAIFPPKPKLQIEERTGPKPFEVVCGCITKLKSTLRDEPIDQWPQDRLEIARGELEPVVKVLWPNRF